MRITQGFTSQTPCEAIRILIHFYFTSLCVLKTLMHENRGKKWASVYYKYDFVYICATINTF